MKWANTLRRRRLLADEDAAVVTEDDDGGNADAASRNIVQHYVLPVPFNFYLCGLPLCICKRLEFFQGLLCCAVVVACGAILSLLFPRVRLLRSSGGVDN